MNESYYDKKGPKIGIDTIERAKKNEEENSS